MSTLLLKSGIFFIYLPFSVLGLHKQDLRCGGMCLPRNFYLFHLFIFKLMLIYLVMADLKTYVDEHVVSRPQASKPMPETQSFVLHFSYNTAIKWHSCNITDGSFSQCICCGFNECLN